MHVLASRQPWLERNTCSLYHHHTPVYKWCLLWKSPSGNFGPIHVRADPFLVCVQVYGTLECCWDAKPLASGRMQEGATTGVSISEPSDCVSCFLCVWTMEEKSHGYHRSQACLSHQTSGLPTNEPGEPNSMNTWKAQPRAGIRAIAGG